MPIRPYLKDSSFDPDQITAMSEALAQACRMLEANPRPGLMTDVVASKIIELARGGERDSTKLSALALAENLAKPPEGLSGWLVLPWWGAP